MMKNVSRRSFLAMAGAAPLVPAFAQKKNVPIGLELYSVRNEFTKDPKAVVTAVAKIGYQVVEYWAPYFAWPVEQVKEMRKLMDDLGIKCNSTHNGMNAYRGDGIAKAIEYNQILGAKYIVLASAGNVKGLDGWKTVADDISKGHEQFRKAGLAGGYHNHQAEFVEVEGKRPMEILAAGTPKDFMLQLDVGTCVEVGSDPVQWINSHPGRIRCMHVKDWGKAEGKGYQVLFGEGDVQWEKVFDAAEKTGGIEYYLIEQEGSRFPALETVEKCLASYKKLHG